MLEHGGRLRKAAQRYGIALEDWLDLSTGLAPMPWPIPHIPLSAWARLPETNDGLEEAAACYYRASRVLPAAGSQAAIQALPTLRPEGRIGVLAPCYAEHEQAWERAGHYVVPLSLDDVEAALSTLDVLVLVNPNNPTGQLIEPERLLRWHAKLTDRGGWLVVDEAFMDLSPAYSLASWTDRQGLIVLRSFGKFFGLAGIRLGFVLAEANLLERLDDILGPWTVSGPARAVAREILLDEGGHDRQRKRLATAGQRLADVLTAHELVPDGGCGLFQWLSRPDAEALHEFLARRAILTRFFPSIAGIRFGLPCDEAGWTRLTLALQAYKDSL
ncbi:threonine-phosphate decarboxylase CobD [Pseudomonas sp. MAG002Y]|uniref:threonine-phosphate decarboxylase CobD n=1 Tax=Pseudomonas sp. MAG002Y TaxID=2678690 RepID=UPI001C60A0CB|nr:threonine-phosphate decarboxylase CobD [Pseudomonas sp. MAG002Y]MBW5415173.1 threonine-phosphate decarboxylase [Pseudomonas sp. MAG002Y]